MQTPAQDPTEALISRISGPYSVLWLSEEGDDDVLSTGLSLESAFSRLMAAAGHAPVFERIGPSMRLVIGEETYRVSSGKPDEEEAQREIMLSAVSHAWGEYAVVRND
jgi:hypothetical protein